jgi:hypothetical protein
MPKLEPTHAFALSAAQGWTGLGNPAEAVAELGHVTAANQDHPGVLEVRWAAFVAEPRWLELALTAACDLRRVAPENAMADSIAPAPCDACPMAGSIRIGSPAARACKISQ